MSKVIIPRNNNKKPSFSVTKIQDENQTVDDLETEYVFNESKTCKVSGDENPSE
jgi:hypothetical protein